MSWEIKFALIIWHIRGLCSIKTSCKCHSLKHPPLNKQSIYLTKLHQWLIWIWDGMWHHRGTNICISRSKHWLITGVQSLNGWHLYTAYRCTFAFWHGLLTIGQTEEWTRLFDYRQARKDSPLKTRSFQTEGQNEGWKFHTYSHEKKLGHPLEFHSFPYQHIVKKVLGRSYN